MPTPVVDFHFARTTRRARSRSVSYISDGGTPVVEQPIRMVSCDTPEKAGYAGRAEISQAKLDACHDRLDGGYYPRIPAELRNYLLERLAQDAAERHVSAGNRATEAFQAMLDDRLTQPDGSRRSTAIVPTGELVDTNGRLLAYLAPWFSGSQSDPLPPRGDPARRTFNLQMLEDGWAALFPIYPSLPSNDDMNLAIAAAEIAWNEKRGAWDEFGDDLLLAYEFRVCVKLGTAETAAEGIAAAFQRVCVDLRDLRVVGEFGFHMVPPPYRLWVWKDDIQQAREDLTLIG